MTCQHLQRAAALLPHPLCEDEYRIADYEEFLAQNELGLAFEFLEGIGEANECSREFWTALLAAAENMNSEQYALLCRKHLE